MWLLGLFSGGHGGTGQGCQSGKISWNRQCLEDSMLERTTALEAGENKDLAGSWDAMRMLAS